jgi:formylglycine-generating enzyme required for sulfatase activity
MAQPDATFSDAYSGLEPTGASLEPEMILIPAGEFLMGSDPERDKEAKDREQPQHRLYLPDYYIAKTPVTNSQFAAFVNVFFRDQREARERGRPPSGRGDHPAVYVSWEDAVAYCNWLAGVTRAPYRLPSEAEWEKAARGTDGRIYPWGDQKPDESRCNFGNSVGDTTPVGRYSPQGDSPYGCVDMAGNTWEWTLSLWGRHALRSDFDYPYGPGDGREDTRADAKVLRGVRGGAYYNEQDFLRCAYRNRNSPFRLLSRVQGFRVAMSASE